jgi:predicted  nucleic acid-binding Zn-ribbon protein
MKENTLEEMLRNLYALQLVDLKLEEIHELKGDLPGIVDALQAQVDEADASLKKLTDQSKALKIERERADSDIVELTEKIEKYKNQQLQVKSNKQYDALSKEIDAAESTITGREKTLESFEGKMQTTKTDIDAITAKLTELNAELDDRQKDLAEVNKEHEKEETKYRQERSKLSAKIAKPEIERYERIRKAKGGKAVVLVKRGSCGGCFGTIPPQWILELRQSTRMMMCEHCGRIIVSDSVVAENAVAG